MINEVAQVLTVAVCVPQVQVCQNEGKLGLRWIMRWPISIFTRSESMMPGHKHPILRITLALGLSVAGLSCSDSKDGNAEPAPQEQPSRKKPTPAPSPTPAETPTNNRPPTSSAPSADKETDSTEADVSRPQLSQPAQDPNSLLVCESAILGPALLKCRLKESVLREKRDTPKVFQVDYKFPCTPTGAIGIAVRADDTQVTSFLQLGMEGTVVVVGKGPLLLVDVDKDRTFLKRFNVGCSLTITDIRENEMR